jgi:N-acylglucosamine-6-phosphate 2-epimerase
MRSTMRLVRYGSVIVSCQADPGSPLHDPTLTAVMARAAEQGGAGGFRVEGAADTGAVRAVSKLPIIGIKKGERDVRRVFITPAFADAEAVVRAGADVVALDATDRPRPGGVSLHQLVERIHTELGVPVLGDVDTVGSGRFALSAGVDALATTLSGYTGGPVHDEPDFDLIGDLVSLQSCPVFAEGRVSRAEHVEAAFAAGAHAVVVGRAITDPMRITQRFVAAAPCGDGTRAQGG